MSQKVLFLHGYGARPGGVKPQLLRQAGFDVTNPLLPDDDFEASLRIAQNSLAQSVPDVVVGSSRGGAVALELELGDVPCVLIAPAWKHWGRHPKPAARTTILHSASDATIPLGDSRELIERCGLPQETLIVVGENHFMNDPAAHEALIAAIRSLAAG